MGKQKAEKGSFAHPWGEQRSEVLDTGHSILMTGGMGVGDGAAGSRSRRRREMALGGERTMQRTDDVRGAVRSKRTPFLTSVTSTRLKRTFRVKKAGGAAPQATATSAQDFALHGGRAAGRARRERRASSQGRIWAPAVCACAFRVPVRVQVRVRVPGASVRAGVRARSGCQCAGACADFRYGSGGRRGA